MWCERLVIKLSIGSAVACIDDVVYFELVYVQGTFVHNLIDAPALLLLSVVCGDVESVLSSLRLLEDAWS